MGGEDQMSATGNGQKFSDSLDDAKDYCLDSCHLLSLSLFDFVLSVVLSILKPEVNVNFLGSYKPGFCEFFKCPGEDRLTHVFRKMDQRMEVMDR